MEHNKLILSDCDGVFLDWNNHYHNWMQAQGYERMRYSTEFMQHLDYDGIDEGKQRDLLQQFHTSSWMNKFPPYRGAEQYVKDLVAEGYRFHIITAIGGVPNEENMLRARQKNLYDIFGEDAFYKITITPTYEPGGKRPVLQEYQDTDLHWIEDNANNAILGHELGLNSILMNEDHNEHVEIPGDIKRVNDWSEIFSHFVS